jgi:hypothetical protein
MADTGDGSMTCIVGMVERGQVHLGGDAAASSESDIETLRHPKVFALGPVVIGSIESLRMGQVLRYGFIPPHRARSLDLMEYMVTTFVRALRRTIGAAGLEAESNGLEGADRIFGPFMPGAILVGMDGRLFRVAENYEIVERGAWDAIGSGERHALAAFSAQDVMLREARRQGVALSYPARKRMLDALSISEAHSVGVRPPFTIVSTPSTRPKKLP